MAIKKLKKLIPAVSNSSKLINKDITETIHASCQEELKVQTQSVQFLKKTFKNLNAALAKAMTKRRMLKKKKMQIAKKAGYPVKSAMKKQLEQAKADYLVSMDEVKMIQQSIEQIREQVRMAKEQIKKLNAISRSIKKMEKRWNKAIAAKFRTKPKKAQAGRKVKKEKIVDAQIVLDDNSIIE